MNPKYFGNLDTLDPIGILAHLNLRMVVEPKYYVMFQEAIGPPQYFLTILLTEDFLHYLGCIKPNWCRISSIKSMTGFLRIP